MTIPAIAMPRPLSSLEASISRRARQPSTIATSEPRPKIQTIPTITDAIAGPLVSSDPAASSRPLSTRASVAHAAQDPLSVALGRDGLAEVDAREAVLVAA